MIYIKSLLAISMCVLFYTAGYYYKSDSDEVIKLKKEIDRLTPYEYWFKDHKDKCDTMHIDCFNTRN